MTLTKYNKGYALAALHNRIRRWCGYPCRMKWW